MQQVILILRTVNNFLAICSDKTGTLTLNQMTVMKVYLLVANFFTWQMWLSGNVFEEVKDIKSTPALLDLLFTGISVNSTAYESKNDRGIKVSSCV